MHGHKKLSGCSLGSKLLGMPFKKAPAEGPFFLVGEMSETDEDLLLRLIEEVEEIVRLERYEL